MIESSSPADKIRALRPEPSRFSCYIQFHPDQDQAKVGQTLDWLNKRMQELEMDRFHTVHITVSHQEKEDACDC
mgnify:CR=1 FL=1